MFGIRWPFLNGATLSTKRGSNFETRVVAPHSTRTNLSPETLFLVCSRHLQAPNRRQISVRKPDIFDDQMTCDAPRQACSGEHKTNSHRMVKIFQRPVRAVR